MTARSFRLSASLLKEHRAGAVLALADESGARAYSMRTGRPDRLWAFSHERLPRAQGSAAPTTATTPEGTHARELADGPDTSGVAVLQVHGPFASRGQVEECGYLPGYDDLEASFAEVLSDRRVTAIVMDVDSPGGDVPRLEETCRRIEAAIAASGKPVLAWVDELAASAAYRIACMAEQIFTPPAGRLGSIGTLAVHWDESQALAAAGVKPTIVRSPAGKAAGHPAEPLSDVGLARLQQLVAESDAAFVNAVSAARAIEPAALLDLDGALRSGEAAVQAGLADGVDTLEGVIALAAARAALNPKPASAATTTPAGGAPAQAQEAASVNVSPALAALVPGLSLAAGPAAVEAAVLPLLALAKTALTLTGATDPERAEGILRALERDAAAVPALRAQVADIDKAKADRVAAEEAAERRALVAQMVKGGRLTPADAWARDAAGEISGVAAEWDRPSPDGRGISIVSLRAMASKLTPLGHEREAKPSAPRAGAADPELVARAAASGLDPAIRAEAERLTAQGLSRPAVSASAAAVAAGDME